MSNDDFDQRRRRTLHIDSARQDEIRRLILFAIFGAFALMLMLGAWSMVYRVEASDEGVVLRFGKQVTTVPPGLHIKFPWPIDTVYQVPVQRIQTLEFGFETEQAGRQTQFAPQTADDLEVAEMLTGDLNLGHVEWIVQYRIKDPMQYLFKVGSTESIDTSVLPSGSRGDVNPAVPDTIRDVSESVMRKLVGDSSIDFVLTIGREQLAKEAEDLIQEELDGFEAGVDIVTVKLQTTSPPTVAVQDAFQAVDRSRQKKEQVVNEAIGERNSKIPAARGARDQAIAEAEGYENRVILETTGEVNAFLAKLAEYEKAPEITRKRLYLEAMEVILATAGGKTIIDESVQGVLPLLNLDQGTLPPVAGKSATSAKGSQR
ncbi:MAG: FtsH protease activity modulator HflK [Planctomycetales bacterium]|nr:FtsH protease activity modulator HflK [Planctomycetales bacterium]